MNWLWSNLDLVGELMLVHLALSVPAIILSFVISVPIGWVAHRNRWSRGVLLSLCALLYAVPSLALLIALPVVTGLRTTSPVNLVIALTLYGIAVIGVQSLGSLFTDGLQRGIQAEIVTGIVATIVLAVGLDWLAVLIGRLVMPWSRPSAADRRRSVARVQRVDAA